MKKNATPKSTNKNASAKQKIPAAVGTRIMSSASQFRTKLVRDPKKYPGSIAITGHEYLDAISTSSATEGKNLLTVYLNPNQFANTRLQKYAELYDKYIFRRFVLHYTSADPSTATGQYIIAYDRDYADTTPSADSDGIREYFAMSGSQISNVYLSSSFRCPLADPQDFYYTNDTGYEGRLVYQGQLYMAAVSGSTFHGSLWIEYECEFFDPQLEPGIPARITSASGSVALVGDTAGHFDGFNYLSSVTPTNGPQFSVVTSVAGNFPLDPAFHVGYKGLLLGPGNYYFENRYAMKTDITGEGLTSFSIWPYKYTKAVAMGTEHPSVASDVVVSVVENSGLGIADTNSSATLRFFLSIPPTAATIWLFLTGLTTAPSTTVTYADAILSIIIAKVNQLSSTMSIKKESVVVLGNEDNGSYLFDETFPVSMIVKKTGKISPESKEDLEERIQLLKLKLKSIKESEQKSQTPEIIKKT